MEKRAKWKRKVWLPMPLPADRPVSGMKVRYSISTKGGILLLIIYYSYRGSKYSQHIWLDWSSWEHGQSRWRNGNAYWHYTWL